MFRKLKTYFGKKSTELTLEYMVNHIERNRSEFTRLVEEIKSDPELQEQVRSMMASEKEAS